MGNDDEASLGDAGERDICRRLERLPDYERDGWGEGPWDEEPDLVEWRNRALPGLALLVVRSHTTGGLCGYAGVPPGHPMHGKTYQDLDDAGLEVHGGLTYADACAGHICHVPKPGESDDVWWFGFDCGHAFDVSPRIDALIRRHANPPYFKFEYSQYRPLAYVMAEAERLGRQLAKEG